VDADNDRAVNDNRAGNHDDNSSGNDDNPSRNHGSNNRANYPSGRLTWDAAFKDSPSFSAHCSS
jgi:hypothetical protein